MSTPSWTIPELIIIITVTVTLVHVFVANGTINAAALAGACSPTAVPCRKLIFILQARYLNSFSRLLPCLNEKLAFAIIEAELATGVDGVYESRKQKLNGDFGEGLHMYIVQVSSQFVPC